MTPSDRLFAEDLEAGTEYDLGEYALSHDAIVAFAQEWDPQPFHLDDEAAREHYFGGVVASGAQSIAIFQRLVVLAVYQHWNVLAGRSLSGITFLRPVRAGAVLEGRMTVTSVTMTHPERALVQQSGALFVGGEQVLGLTAELYIYRR